MRHRLVAVAAAAALAALVAGGCGREPADLFVVTRSGTLPDAQVTIRVTDGGQASCNGGDLEKIEDDQLLDARGLVRDLEPDAERDLTLEGRPGSQLRYRVRMEKGTVSFADNSVQRRPELAQMQALVRSVARDVCGLPR